MSLNLRKLQGQHVLFIGGSSGLGLAAAEGALVAGAMVTIASSSRDRLDAAVARLTAAIPGGQIKAIVVDFSVSDTDAALRNLRETAEKGFGPIQHIVYSAGDWFPMVPLVEFSTEDLAKASKIRVLVVFVLAKQIAQGHWLARDRSCSLSITGGNISMKPTPGYLLSAFIGAGLEGSVRSLALELAPIRVNGVAPGWVNTEMWGAAREKMRKAMNATVLTGHAGQAEDVCEAYLYLMKDRNVTGQIIRSESGAMLLSRESGGR